MAAGDSTSAALSQVARLLWKMRLTRGWSCTELASKAAVPLETVLAYEAKPASLTAQTANRMLGALGRDPRDADLFGPPPFSTASPPQWLLDQMECKMIELEAALRIDEDRYRDALSRLERALELSPSPERTGRLLLSKAAVLGELGRAKPALQALEEAEGCLDAAKEPKLWLRLRQEQIHLLCQTGRHDAAEARRAEMLELATRVGDARQRLEARCLAGRVAAGMGQTAEALRILQPVRDELLVAGQPFEATAVGLDLGGVLAAQGKLPELAELCAQLEPLARTKTFPGAARTALTTFCWMVRHHRLGAELGCRLAAEFRGGGRRLRRPYDLPV